MTPDAFDTRIAALREAHERTVAAAQQSAAASSACALAAIDEVEAIASRTPVDPAHREALRITADRAYALSRGLAAFEEQARESLIRDVLVAHGLVEKVTP